MYTPVNPSFTIIINYIDIFSLYELELNSNLYFPWHLAHETTVFAKTKEVQVILAILDFFCKMKIKKGLPSETNNTQNHKIMKTGFHFTLSKMFHRTQFKYFFFNFHRL